MNSFQAFQLNRAYDVTMVRQGFSWRLLVLGPVGFLLSRSWVVFALSACVAILLLRFGGAYTTFASMGFNLALAMFGAELTGWEVRLKGGVAAGIWFGRSMAEARLSYFSKLRVVS